MKSLLTGIIALFWAALSVAQNEVNPVAWRMEVKDIAGEEGYKEVHFQAKIDKDWQLYSNDFSPELGPMVTEFQYVKHGDIELISGTIPQGSHRKYDELWGGEYAYFEETAHFIQKIKAITANPKVECQITYQVCNTLDGKCIPYDITLNNF